MESSLRERLFDKPHKYLYATPAPLNIISVFDDLRFDRSDLDLMSPAMRKHVVSSLTKLGFKQTSGTKVENKEWDITVYIPKPSVLASSPFDITRYTPKREQDYYALTPTQTACQIINHFDLGEAVNQILELVQRQPINLFKIHDYLEGTPQHDDFIQAIGHIKYQQRIASEKQPLASMRALK